MSNKKNFGKIIAIFIMAVVVFGTTSCNRGYGCPYNTSITTGLSNLLSINK